jgi:hypothetical protein
VSSSSVPSLGGHRQLGQLVGKWRAPSISSNKRQHDGIRQPVGVWYLPPNWCAIAHISTLARGEGEARVLRPAPSLSRVTRSCHRRRRPAGSQKNQPNGRKRYAVGIGTFPPTKASTAWGQRITPVAGRDMRRQSGREQRSSAAIRVPCAGSRSPASCTFSDLK